MLHTSTTSRWRTALVGALVATVSLLPSAVADKTQADYFIHDLPGAPEGPLLKMHAGHIEVDAAHNSNLFFWHYQNRHIADRQRTVLWLNGGPGCSSMDGAMMEVGPYRVREGGNLEYNNGSWDEFANLLFVDQPVGTGFSYVNTDSYLTDLDQMADHMMTFLEKWFALFPEYEHDDLYIAGESYAGQHIPYIARAILNRNKNQAKRQWNLKGLLIGNGWMSPVDQYLAYLPFAYQNGMLQADTDAARRVEQQQAICIKKLNDGGHNHVDTSECEQIMVNILEETKDRKADRMNQCVNMYDIRLRDDASCGMNWPPDLSDVTPYLRRPDVIQALNINSDKKTGWSECNGAVSGHFRAKNSEPTVKFMPELLAQVPVLLFSGDKDFICNHMGTEAMIENMSWNGGKGFELSSGVWAPKQDWTFEGEPAGTYQEVRNLTYVVFYNSSHMVPFDYPRRTRDMLDRFMQVDISAIGGNPSDSRIDGEKGPLTSVGDHPNSTQAEEDKTKQLKEAEWKAYYRSGEVVLVILIIVAAAWGIFLWRSRRANSTYKGDDSDEGRESLLTGMGLDNFRRRERRQDIEAADFDERELDDLDDGPKKSTNGYKEVNEKDRHPANDSTPGDQYHGGNVTNPFDERVVNYFTASEIATLQSRLNKQLGPEYISTRPGNGGGKVAYLEGNKAIALANEVFGFNGWSSSLGQVQIDYVDEHQNGKVSLGLSIVVRITLKDGTYHEDIGYGSIENGKGKAASFEKAKKEAATDGLKRALRTFGNVLGNCLYDKEYLKKVQAMKVKPIKFAEDNLYRHADFAPPPQDGQALVKREPQRTPMRPNQVLRTRTEHLGDSFNAEFDDEFDGNLFDGVDVSEAHGDEVSFETGSAPTEAELKAIQGRRLANGPNGVSSARTSPIRQTHPPQQPVPRGSGANGISGQGGVQHQQQQRPNQAPGRPMPNGQMQRQPQTPVPHQNQARPEQNRARMAPPTTDTHTASRPPAQQQIAQQQPQGQPLRPTPPEVQQGSGQRPPPQAQATTAPSANQQPPSGRPPVGFVTSRAAELLQTAEGNLPINGLPTFNPHVESPIPKEQRTPGFDRNRSAPVKRETVGAPPAPPPAAQPASSSRPSGPVPSRPTNFVNPQQDLNRRIGMPGAPYAMSPSANRGAYKPPTFANGAAGVKRERPPLQDVSNQGPNGASGAGEGPDVKRQRVEAATTGTGAENAGPGAVGT
ncbi:Alpha/Beta hydrolase protein [Paraphoma chrysanthemicola]|uniref:Pheromone-processing carboxypeptidase KEX1 n=1 Tax=Paraphoma chrysanthemicola TaxID=798071 RepID=A0A8K0RGT1_9PLEO|nr:Alpha/Beta hydrolase protein [Paraphoma chrysanthemicola]